MDAFVALFGLFALAFAAATILPAQSEAALIGLQLAGYPVVLLLSWAPFGGDALTVTAGILREPFWSFLLLVAVAKTGRYVALAAATMGLAG